jgi:hypothetical protein
MKVNVVMLCCNRHMLTHQALRTLRRNTPAELFNLTIVDDQSAIPPMLKEGDAYLKIENSKHITGQARNLSVYWSEKVFGRGDYLYLSDNDVYFMPGWLDRLVSTFNHEEHVGFKLMGGWNHQYMQPKTGIMKSAGGEGGYQIAEHDAVTGASQLMRWETWDKYGPLDAHAQGVCQGEDWQFCQKIIKDGGRVGSIYPRVVFNCGLTNSYGAPSVGADVVLAELKEAKKQHPDLYYE